MGNNLIRSQGTSDICCVPYLPVGLWPSICSAFFLLMHPVDHILRKTGTECFPDWQFVHSCAQKTPPAPRRYKHLYPASRSKVACFLCDKPKGESRCNGLTLTDFRLNRPLRFNSQAPALIAVTRPNALTCAIRLAQATHASFN